MPFLRQKPGGPAIRVGAGRGPLLTAPTGTAGTGTTTGGTTGTTTTAAPDGALVLPDGNWTVLPGGDALALPAA